MTPETEVLEQVQSRAHQAAVQALAPILYMTHCESRGWQDANGQLRPWQSIKDSERAHWTAVAREAITRCKTGRA